VLASLEDADLRERVQAASMARGAAGGDTDTRDVLLEIVRLRAERARLLGYEHHAAYVAADTTAGSAEAVAEMLGRLAPAAVANARREAEALATADGAPAGGVRAADRSFLSETVRKERLHRAAPLPGARPRRARRRLQGRHPALRALVHRADRPRGLPPRRARVRGVRHAGAGGAGHRHGPVPRRLVHARVEARRRVDEQPG